MKYVYTHRAGFAAAYIVVNIIIQCINVLQKILWHQLRIMPAWQLNSAQVAHDNG